MIGECPLLIGLVAVVFPPQSHCSPPWSIRHGRSLGWIHSTGGHMEWSNRCACGSVSSRFFRGIMYFVLAIFCGFPTPTAVMGQAANAGSVAGLVTDTSGGAVVGATIALTDKATGTPRTTASNEAGRY